MTFTHAIARRPAMNAGEGLTSARFGVPDPERMLAQHRTYIGILESIDLQVTVLDADENFRDQQSYGLWQQVRLSTFGLEQ